MSKLVELPGEHGKWKVVDMCRSPRPVAFLKSDCRTPYEIHDPDEYCILRRVKEKPMPEIGLFDGISWEAGDRINVGLVTQTGTYGDIAARTCLGQLHHVKRRDILRIYVDGDCVWQRGES